MIKRRTEPEAMGFYTIINRGAIDWVDTTESLVNHKSQPGLEDLDKLITTKKWSEYVVSYVSDADQLDQQP